MTCDECLSILATVPVAELDPTSRVRQHGATCADCVRIITLITNGEQDLAFALDNVPSSRPAGHIVEKAMLMARRRRVRRVVSVALTLIVAVTLWITWLRVIAPAMRETAALVGGNLRTETLVLRCLTPDQAGDLISPYVRASGSAYYRARSSLGVITVRATPEELLKVKMLLDQLDGPGARSCPAALQPPNGAARTNPLARPEIL